jgi:lipid-binding SYLF domain-containing protein
MRYLWALLMISVIALPAAAQHKEKARIENASIVMNEILNMPENIPQELLDRSSCVIVLPSVVRFAIGFGGSYGRGLMTCRGGRDYKGPWGTPTMMALEGGSFGLQLGGQATDYVLLVMNSRGADPILSSKVKLGAGISAAAGPKGRDLIAATDATLRAEILSYSRSRGLFAGAYLEGSTLRPDNEANEKLYGKKLTAREIALEGKVAPPEEAEKLLTLLNKRSPKNLSAATSSARAGVDMDCLEKRAVTGLILKARPEQETRDRPPG